MAQAVTALGLEMHNVVVGCAHPEAPCFASLNFRREPGPRSIAEILTDIAQTEEWFTLFRSHLRSLPEEGSTPEERSWEPYQPSPEFKQHGSLVCKVEKKVLRAIRAGVGSHPAHAERLLTTVKGRILSLKAAHLTEVGRQRMLPATESGDSLYIHFPSGQWRPHRWPGQDTTWWVKQMALYARQVKRGTGVVTFHGHPS